jgi:type II secretion system protein H
MRPRLSTGISRAFTLIEMMTVIVIIGIMTAMIIPEMKGTFEDALLRATARELVNAIELASSQAISLNQHLRVRLDPTAKRFSIERRVHEGRLEEFAPLPDVSGSAGELDKRIAIEIRRPGAESSNASGAGAAPTQDTAEPISFYPDGTADAAMILLKDRAGFRLGLRVNPITSRVNIVELERE